MRFIAVSLIGETVSVKLDKTTALLLERVISDVDEQLRTVMPNHPITEFRDKLRGALALLRRNG